MKYRLLRFRWYRRWRGGHYEYWRFSLGGRIFASWFPCPAHCHAKVGCKPAEYYIGEPVCEDYPDTCYWWPEEDWRWLMQWLKDLGV